MKFKGKTIVAIIVSCSLILLLGFLHFSNAVSDEYQTDWVIHTHEVINGSKQLIKDVVDMETGLRGYVITNNKEFLEPLIDAQVNWKSTFKDLKELVSDNPEQLERLDHIMSLHNKWKKDVLNPILTANESKQRNIAFNLSSAF